MHDDDEPNAPRWYNPVVSLGNILTMLMMLGGGIGVGAIVIIWGIRLEGMVNTEKQVNAERLEAANSRIDRVEQAVATQRQDMERTLGEIKTEIRGGFNRLEEKLDKKADKR